MTAATTVSQTVVQAAGGAGTLAAGAVIAAYSLGSELLAQTAGTFPDIAEPVSITEVCGKVVVFLGVAVGAVLAIKVGMALLSGIMSWFGVGKRRTV